MSESVTTLFELYRGPRASKLYSEDVTQLEHALQCASLAQDAGAEDELVAAALLHDVGHLLTGEREAGAPRGVDDRHEVVGARYLRTWFGPGVTAPVTLHVPAKRYLCATDGGYHDTLSAASVHSLSLQGGPMDDEECAAFERLPGSESAVALRRWDDDAKVVGAECAALDSYERMLRRLADAPKIS